MPLEPQKQLVCLSNKHLGSRAGILRGMATVHCWEKGLSSKWIASTDYPQRHYACTWRIYVIVQYRGRRMQAA